MGEKTITIEIDEQGNSSLDLTGFQGNGCGEVAKALQGADAVDRVAEEAGVSRGSRREACRGAAARVNIGGEDGRSGLYGNDLPA